MRLTFHFVNEERHVQMDLLIDADDLVIGCHRRRHGHCENTIVTIDTIVTIVPIVTIVTIDVSSSANQQRSADAESQ